MAMTVSGAGVKSSVEQVLVDVIESINQAGPFSATQPGTYSRGRAPFPQQSSGGIAGTIFQTAALGTGVFDATSGYWYFQIASAAARQNRHATPASVSHMPLAKKFNAAGTVPIPLQPPLKRYTISLPMRSAVAATTVEFGMAVSNGGLTGLGTSQAIVWSSDPARSAGAWEPRYRLTNAGAIVNGTPSAFIPGAVTWNVLAIRYTEGATPKIEWLIDGVPLYEISGDANMPTETAIGSPFMPYIGINAGIGRTLEYLGARFIIEEV